MGEVNTLRLISEDLKQNALVIEMYTVNQQILSKFFLGLV